VKKDHHQKVQDYKDKTEKMLIKNNEKNIYDVFRLGYKCRYTDFHQQTRRQGLMHFLTLIGLGVKKNCIEA
jgi:hypothetical protein